MRPSVIFLVPLLVRCMESTDPGDEFDDHAFSYLPREIVTENILGQESASNLLLLSMTSKGFHELAESVLNNRCSEDYSDLLQEQKELFLNPDEKACRPFNFIRRAWPTSKSPYKALYLKNMLQKIFESIRGLSISKELECYEHLPGYPKVSKTVLRMKLAKYFQMYTDSLTEIPWKYFSDLAADNLKKIFPENLQEIVPQLIGMGKYGIIEDIIHDERNGSVLASCMPFSLEFVNDLIVTKSFKDTLERCGGLGQFAEHYNNDHPKLVFNFGLDFNTTVDLLIAIEPTKSLDGEFLCGEMIMNGHQPDLSWFENTKVFKNSEMSKIKECYESGNFDSIDDAEIPSAILYSRIRGGLEGKSFEEVHSEIRTFNRNCDYDTSYYSFIISRHFWNDSSHYGESLLENGLTDDIFDRYDLAMVTHDEATKALRDLIPSFVDKENQDLDSFEQFLCKAEQNDWLEIIVEGDHAKDILSYYLSKVQHKFFRERDEEYPMLRTLAKLDGGVQAIRNYDIKHFPFLEEKYVESPGATLEWMLDTCSPELPIFFDHFLFTRCTHCKIYVTEAWPKCHRLRLDVSLTKAISFYSAASQLQSLTVIGIDSENLLSMYMVRALMSTPEGKELAKGLVTETDHQEAILICSMVAPYFNK